MKEIGLNVLFIEDSQDDVFLLQRELKRGGYQPIYQQVDCASSLLSALQSQKWEVIVSDFNIPGFGGMEALDIVRSNGFDLPFVLVSGKVGEEVAVSAIKAGAQDFVSKDSLGKLSMVIQRELEATENDRERRQTLNALRRSEKRHRELLMHAYSLVFEIEADGQILIKNQVFSNILGFGDKQGLHIQNFAPNSLKDSLNRVIAGESITHIHLECTRDNGDIVTLEGNMIPRTSKTQIDGARCFFRDISQRQRYQDQLEAQNLQLIQMQQKLFEQQRLKALGELVQGIAHDFNNVLMPIISYATLLEEPDIAQEQRQKFAQIISQAGRDAHSLIERLNSSYRGGANTRRYPISLQTLVADTVTLSRPSLEKFQETRGIKIEMSVLVEKEHNLFCNPAELRQALLNILINAFDAVREDGVITIATWEKKKTISICIKDTGVGMSPQELERCREAFFSTKDNGTGLGLVMVGSTIDAHEGELLIESQKGRGTTVTFVLPIFGS